jgi:hypothetical protein
MIDDLQCPVDRVMINENKVRIIAFFVLWAGIGYLLSGNIFIPVFLMADFFLRMFNLGSYSLLALIASYFVVWFNLKNKPVDRAPKRFAASVGFIFVVLISITALLHWTILSVSLAIILVLFASLESLAGFCAGCYVYTILHNINGRFKTKRRIV